MLKTFSKEIVQTSSQLVWAKAQYSTSAEEREMVGCLLDFQLTKELPMKTQKPVIDLFVFRKAA